MDIDIALIDIDFTDHVNVQFATEVLARSGLNKRQKEKKSLLLCIAMREERGKHEFLSPKNYSTHCTRTKDLP